MSDSGREALGMLERINRELRGAISASLPCAYEQYLCISMPGTIIDTRLGGSYIPEGERATADVRNMIQVNEAMLTDSMVPLDKVMLGPTGKSVSRSYYTALDMLVPRKTDIGSVDVESDFSAESQSKYSQAMRFLRSKESILTPESEITGSRVDLAKDKAIGMGIQGTVVDRYVEKQLAWSVARGKWDAVRAMAGEARESRPDAQTAAAFSARQKDIKRAQGELHARWMDWVVNGDKFRVDYCFALVDRDSIMARIERGKEATRDAMLTSIDGTEWAQVTLEPKNWATLCRKKALAWADRNPVDVEFLQMRLENLKKMKASYEAYRTTFLDRPIINKDKPKDGKDTAGNKALQTDLGASGSKTVPDPSDSDQEMHKPKDETDMAGNKALQTDLVPAIGTSGSKTVPEPSDPEQEMQEALQEIYLNESLIHERKKAEPDADTSQAKVALVQAKEKWLAASQKLSSVRTRADVSRLEGDGLRTMNTKIESHIAELTAQIRSLESRLAQASPGATNMVMGVKGDKIVRANDIGAEDSHTRGEDKGADAWTKITFDVRNDSDSSSMKEANLGGSFNAEVGNWLASVKAQSTFSKSSRQLESTMSSCSVSGSFSAMLVNIRRPWLHAELFQDFDIDIPDGTKLSPGARIMREWIDSGSDAENTHNRTNYGKFPAYPTAFIVAADTVLEFKSDHATSNEMMSSLQTDSSIQASYGPWGLKAGASAKTDNKESAQRMSVQGESLRIEFQAPQIVGWVSEILPQLPRGVDGKPAGGLNAPPNMAFRANL